MSAPFERGDVDVFNSKEPRPLFHERQIGRQCGLHCVNNLLQFRCYEQEDLNHLSAELLNQRALIQKELGGVDLPGAGTFRKLKAAISDYDVQVLEVALEKHGGTLRWFDKRQSVEKCVLEDDNLLGLIMNRRRWNIQFSDRHWLCIRRFGNGFFNLDSKLTEPEHLGGVEDTLIWLRKCLDLDDGCCLFRVMRKAPQKQRWPRLIGVRRSITAMRKERRTMWGSFNLTPIRKDHLKSRRPKWNCLEKGSLRTQARWFTPRREGREAVVLLKMARSSSLC